MDPVCKDQPVSEIVKANYGSMLQQGSFVAAVFALAYVLKGFVLRKLWMWFITPAFGVVTPHLTVAIGLVVIAGLFGSTFERFAEGNDSQDVNKRAYRGGILLGNLFLRPLLLWGLGFLIHLMQS